MCSDINRRRFLLLFVGVQLIALYAPTVAWLWERWTLSVWHHAHGLLLLPVIGYLIWKELRKVSHMPLSSSAWGFAVLVPALALHMLDAGMHTQLLSAVALVMALPGLSLLFLGPLRTKKILFPIAFLLFTLPIPLAFTERLHFVLRQIATAGTVFIVPKFGILLFNEGTTLHIPNGMLEVADACSGFSTLYAAIATASLLAYMCPKPSRRVLVLLLATPIAIIVNIMRVVLLVFLVYWKGTDVLNTSMHTISGLFTFVLSLPVIFWLGYVPEDGERKR